MAMPATTTDPEKQIAPQFWPDGTPARTHAGRVELRLPLAVDTITPSEPVCDERVADFATWLADGWSPGPIVVRGHSIQAGFQVVNGNHRLAAHRRADWPSIDAWVIPEVELAPGRWTVARHYEVDWTTLTRLDDPSTPTADASSPTPQS